MKKLRKYITQFFSSFSTRYRIQVLDDEKFESRASFRLSALQIFTVFTTVLVLFIFLTIYLVAFTGIREYIPGYADTESKQKINELLLVTDSLEQRVVANEKYTVNLQNIFTGKTTPSEPLKKDTTKNYGALKNSRSQEDSLLREEVARAEKYNVQTGKNSAMGNMLFYAPVRGKILQPFNAGKKQYNVYVVASKEESFKCIMDGTVIMAEWTPEFQYVIAVQHNDQFISIYKHNSAILKTEGDFVKAGEPLGFVAQTNGIFKDPYLQFELWYRGSPVNPEEFIVF